MLNTENVIAKRILLYSVPHAPFQKKIVNITDFIFYFIGQVTKKNLNHKTNENRESQSSYIKERTKTGANMFSSRECIMWTAIYVIEHVAIVTFNAIAIIAFMKKCKLRKRSTYLLLNLAVVDMLVGFSGLWTVYELGLYCKLWRGSLKWWEQHPFAPAIRLTFVVSSLINITIISLERLHATVRPFGHRFVKKWVYGAIIAVSYLIAVLFSIVSLCIPLSYSLERPFNATSSLTSGCIVIIFFSYSLILIKVKCGPQPRHHVVAGRERRLTVTLFIVTFVSLMMWLPFIVQSFLWYTTKIYSSYPSHLTCFDIMLLVVNSLVNPLLYAVRMPEFKRAVKALFCKKTQQRQVRVLPLYAMQ